MNGWYISDSKSDKESQRKADEQRVQEAAATQEWEQAWNQSKALAREHVAERKRAFEESQRPKPTMEQDMAAIRALLEKQQETN